MIKLCCLNDCSWTQTHKYLVRKRTLNHLAKLVFFDIQAIIECGFTLKRVRDMIRTYSQVKLSQHRYGPQLKFSAFLSFINK